MMYNFASDAKKVVSEMALFLPDEERKRLLFDLEHSTEKPVNEDGSIVAFDIAGYEKPSSGGSIMFRVEGSVLDEDGSQLTVLLHSDANGRLMELELVRFDDGSAIRPDWTTLSLF